MDDIRAIRTRLGLNQAELASKLGIHQSTISRFERGDLTLDDRTRLALEALVMRAELAAAANAPAESAAA